MSGAAVLVFDEAAEDSPHPWRWSGQDELYLASLRAEYELDHVASAAGDDLEKVTILCHWVHGRWQHDGANQPERSDPISILREAAQGKRFRCTEYATVLAGCCAAFGIPARLLALMTADCETRAVGASHVVTEAFLPDRGRWIFADAQCDVVATLAGDPLNAVELQRAAAQEDRRFEIGPLSDEDARAYAADILPYLHYLSARADNRVGATDASDRHVVLVPAGSAEPRVFQQRYPSTTATAHGPCPPSIPFQGSGLGVGDGLSDVCRDRRVVDRDPRQLWLPRAP